MANIDAILSQMSSWKAFEDRLYDSEQLCTGRSGIYGIIHGDDIKNSRLRRSWMTIDRTNLVVGEHIADKEN